MLGSKSVVIFENEINPNTLTNIADTIIVSGFFTLKFDNIHTPSLYTLKT